VEDDRTRDERRTTVSEAAEILGISAEAVRGRIRRGTIPVEREGGTVYVLIEGTERYRTTADQSRTTGDQPDDRTDLLIAELQDRVRSLEEANRENRRIIAALTSRIPAIEAPQEATGGAETVEEEPKRAEPHPDTLTPQESVRRPWWRRVFGG
jgi:predicted ArsR family transcriptional regulator